MCRSSQSKEAEQDDCNQLFNQFYFLIDCCCIICSKRQLVFWNKLALEQLTTMKAVGEKR